MNIQTRVGLNVRRLRLQKKLPQLTIAFEADVALNYVGGIENGKKNPTIAVIARLAKALRVDPVALMAPAPESEALPKNLPRGRNVHHQGRKLGVKRRKK